MLQSKPQCIKSGNNDNDNDKYLTFAIRSGFLSGRGSYSVFKVRLLMPHAVAFIRGFSWLEETRSKSSYISSDLCTAAVHWTVMNLLYVRQSKERRSKNHQ